MIAASIMMSRALAPIEIAIANWRLCRRPAKHPRLSAVLPKCRTECRRPTCRGPSRAPSRAGYCRRARDDLVRSLATSISASGPARCAALSGRTAPARHRSRVSDGHLASSEGHCALDGATYDQWTSKTVALHRLCVANGRIVSWHDAENIAKMSRRAGQRGRNPCREARPARTIDLRLPAGYDTMVGDRETLSLRPAPADRAGARDLWRSLSGVARRAQCQSRWRRRRGVAECYQGLKAKGAIVIVIVHRRRPW